jgi:tetratricopeptide (TPR) repeat protein
MLDAYSSCPCGSGKKFKWCCQPIHAEIARAYELDEKGQHEAALRIMDGVVARHADNPEALGRQALLLFQNEKVAEAEQALDKALTLNPRYAFGQYLRGRFRSFEGELAGSLLLYRKAIDLYSAEAKDILAQIYVDVFDAEMKLNHPVAARAAGEIAGRLQPGSEQLRQGMEAVFGPKNPNLPPSARREYKYKPLAADAAAPRRTAWEQALGQAQTGKLADAAAAFVQLTRDDGADRAAWYNLGLTRAWLGENPAAVEALEQYVAQENDEAEAAQAWALVEVLRLGHDMVEQADIVEHTVVVPLLNPQAAVSQLAVLEKEGSLVGVQVNEQQGIMTALLLEEPPPALTPELQAQQSPRLAAYFALLGNILRLWHTQVEPLQRIFDKLRQMMQGHLGEPYQTKAPAKFHDVLSEALVFPRRVATQQEGEAKVRESAQRFFEEVWLQRPLRSLGGVPPADAAAQPLLRRKLLGIVQFLEECAALSLPGYDFDRLRRKLGLAGAAPTAAAGAAAQVDITALGAAELAGLALEQLSATELEQGFHTALKVDAREVAGKFAGALIERPPVAEKPDRYVLYQHLVQQALAEGNTTAALDAINAGESYDCAHNEGRRRNDYELRRAQILAKSGDVNQADDVFQRLIARTPDELRFRSTAAETMLSARQGQRALRFAQEGLAEAVKQNNRDSEAHFRELVSAAQKTG